MNADQLHAAALSRCMEALPDHLTALRQALPKLLPAQFSLLEMLAWQSCLVVGGNDAQAIPVLAALLARQAAEVPAQSGDQVRLHHAQVLQTLPFEILRLAQFSASTYPSLYESYIKVVMLRAEGQARNFSDELLGLEAYNSMMDFKSGAVFANAAGCGALAGSEVSNEVQACGLFGHHLGRAIHIFEDLAALWPRFGEAEAFVPGPNLALAYARHFEHREREKLDQLLEKGLAEAPLSPVLEILEGINAQGYLLMCADQERKRAKSGLERFFPPEQAQGLVDMFDGFFDGLEEMIPTSA